MTILHATKFAAGVNRVAIRGLSQVGELGSGKGKGGGAGGAIRDAGGAFGKKQAGREEEYFHRLEKEQLKTLRLQAAALRKEMEREIEEHEEQAKSHSEAIERLKRRITELKEREEDLKG